MAGSGPNVCSGVETGTPACEAPLDVDTVEALLDAMVSAKPFVEHVVGAAPAADQRPSRDVHVTTALTVEIEAFRAKAPSCPPGSGSADAGGPFPTCVETLFAQEKTFQAIRTIYGTLGDSFAPGVTCLEEDAPDASTGCRRIAIAAGSTVRFQRIGEYNAMFGSTKNYLRIVRPCTAACTTSETRCAASSLCVSSGEEFCILCEGKSEVECACRAGCALMQDGAKCSASTSEDTFIGGTCHGGTCAQ